MFARTTYSRVTKITWTLDAFDVTRALREFVARSVISVGKKPEDLSDVELTEDGGATVVWHNSQHDGTVENGSD